jgi:AraC-like DNA-binding protein
MRLLIGPSRAAYIGPGLNLEPHVNAACTLAFSLNEPMALRTWSKMKGWSDLNEVTAALIPGGTLHHLKCSNGAQMVFYYLDPLQDEARLVTETVLLQARNALCSMDKARLSLKDIEGCLPQRSQSESCSRIRHVLEEIETCPARFNSIDAAASLACLSNSRFRALFAQEVGLPFRRYRLWRRMAHVAKVVSKGASLTEAAIDAGFSDSAHLSASFKAMFGISPGFLLNKGVEICCEVG